MIDFVLVLIQLQTVAASKKRVKYPNLTLSLLATCLIFSNDIILSDYKHAQIQ